MNREILFRGINNVTKEWIIGNLFQRDEQFFIMADNCVVEVIPETVGQFTGLTDRNGRKIFEGDILSAHLDDLFPNEETKLVVEWHETGFYGRNPRGQYDGFENGFVKNFTVISNVHDNPEMVGGTENG